MSQLIFDPIYVFKIFFVVKTIVEFVVGSAGGDPVGIGYPTNSANNVANIEGFFVAAVEFAAEERIIDMYRLAAGGSTDKLDDRRVSGQISPVISASEYSYDIIPSDLDGPITYATLDYVKPTDGISNSSVYSDFFPSNRIVNQGNGTEAELRVFNPNTDATIGNVIISSAYNLTSCPDGFDVGHNNAPGVQDLAFFVSNGNLAILRNNNGTIEWEEIIPLPDPGSPINPYNFTFVDQPLLTVPTSGLSENKYHRTGTVNGGGYIYFNADDGTNGHELWISDGTPGGTYIIKDLNAGPASTYPFDLTAMGGKLYFFASTPTINNGLWVTDGTETGTELVKEFNPGGYSFVDELRSINGTLYFVASDATHGSELWKSDGTEEGTEMIMDIFPGQGTYGPNSSTPRKFTLLNGLVYFSADDGIHGRELWVTDGTTEGTHMVKNINNTGDGSEGSFVNLSPGIVFGSVLYFYADDGVHGKELWVTDGTREGTKMAYDIYPGPVSSNDYAQWGEIAGGDLFVSAEDGVVGRELFIFQNVPSSCPTTALNVKVFVEGAYNSGSMSTALASQIPLRQPFNNETWGYYGDETTTNSILTANNIVDWVVVELREGTTADDAEPIARKAALLKSDGTVIDADGSADILFKWVPAGDYYLTVYHRNHLAVLSSSMVTLTNL